MSSHHEKSPESPSRLQVHRVNPGVVQNVLMLSDRYGGLLTHWQRGRSVLCRGPECSPALHRVDAIWKGYTAAMIWLPDRTRWLPIVLELSEALEAELRSWYSRGQVWRLSREPCTRAKRSPVRGVLLETRPAEQVPDAFEFGPVVALLYHCPEIGLGVPNPQPLPQYVVPSSLPPPKATTKAKDAGEPRKPQPTREQLQELRRRAAGIGAPPEANGEAKRPAVS